MQPVADDLPHMPGDSLALVLGDRIYGDDREPDHLGALRRMPVPPEMAELRAVLERQSQLLALPEGSRAEAIYAAFGKDLELLIRYRDAFRKTVDAALRARASANDKTAQAFLDRIARQISEVVYEPTLDLGPNAVVLGAGELRSRLRDQFCTDVAQLARSVAVWLHVLAEGQFVSVIEWFNPRAIRYHFFRMESRRQELDRSRSVSGDAFSGRTVTTTTRVRSEFFSERRVHTVVNARVHALDDYHQRVPKRIARLIDVVPAEVRPFLSIIDGTVSQEEIHRRLTESKIETTTRSVFIPDPALALFNTWAINGWGGSTPEDARSLYRGHPLSKANKYLVAELAGSALITAVGAIVEGRRGAIVVALICAILTGFQQLGMRIPSGRHLEDGTNPGGDG
jgi:hypothetical protein